MWRTKKKNIITRFSLSSTFARELRRGFSVSNNDSNRLRYFSLTISLKINPSSLADGVILYAAQNHQGIGKFISVTLKNRQIEYRYTVAGE